MEARQPCTIGGSNVFTRPSVKFCIKRQIINKNSHKTIGTDSAFPDSSMID
jgi:hypothetical protein